MIPCKKDIDKAENKVYGNHNRPGGREMEDQSKRIEALRTALLLLLDNIDYEAGNCRVNEMIGAVLPKEILRKAREAAKA
jgi:hypothetical protein